MDAGTEYDGRGAAQSPAPSTLLLGLGNDILCDDSIGLRIAAAIRDRQPPLANLTVKLTTEMGVALLDLILGFERLVIVDAVQTAQATPGTIHRIDPTSLPTLATAAPHFVGIGETLALGRTLRLPVPDTVVILAIEVSDPYTVSTEMTPSLQAQMSRLVADVERLLML